MLLPASTKVPRPCLVSAPAPERLFEIVMLKFEESMNAPPALIAAVVRKFMKFVLFALACNVPPLKLNVLL